MQVLHSPVHLIANFNTTPTIRPTTHHNGLVIIQPTAPLRAQSNPDQWRKAAAHAISVKNHQPSALPAFNHDQDQGIQQGCRRPPSPRPPRQQGQAVGGGHVLRAQVDFYAELRDHLAVNEASSGLQAVDALALIADDDSLPATLTEVVTLLPPPGSFEDGQPPTHALFAPEPDTTIKRPAPRNKAQSKRPAKKRRTTANSLKYSLELPVDVPAAIRRDVDRLIKEAAGRGKTPFRLAYPWSGQRAWYDPQEHPLLHLLHWRFWMKHRATFFICALYAPTGNSDARRKKKSVAVQVRLRLISANIEVFGYYSFLAQLEDKAHDTLMWYGGKAAAHSTQA
ncbi:uncharacterized protein PITG_17650 [Phytophthora infestans T30-4]|uniref:Uncharacterized protein n=1 Tax=Phytophthora infestans (strain T30-4) TaxID=403677 RepID=D0NWJ5_PHYIT|nr:uncharacterized protein PITG_17650 [Phytophthora infestans T30-4]EEY67058.1 conserved hypothetical protein [Phytophthora infestans T30-4]|eukprot:XP_002896510.1 conserved hypothetical protein [Phytophthora infestans T30-4]